MHRVGIGSTLVWRDGVGAFETYTYTCGGTALAAYDVNTTTLVARRRWRHFRITPTLVVVGVGGISDKHILLWRGGIGGV